jgi:S1-C subfamily serine protease
MAFALLLANAVSAAMVPPTRPGWLGLGFTYHVNARSAGDVNGWMLVEEVSIGGPAQRAGLRAQDVIVAIDGHPLRFDGERAVLDYLGHIRPHQQIVLATIRIHERRVVRVIAAEMTDDQYVVWRNNFEIVKPKVKR